MDLDRQPHDTTDSEPHAFDARWMTFADLAAIRGTSKRAAVTLVRRHGWRRQRNNEGHVIALVPLTWATPEQAYKEPYGTTSQALSEAHKEANTAAFEVALTVATERAERAEQRADEANRRADVAVALAVRALAHFSEAERRLRMDLDRAQHDAEAAQQTAAELREADEARRARGGDGHGGRGGDGHGSERRGGDNDAVYHLVGCADRGSCRGCDRDNDRRVGRRCQYLRYLAFGRPAAVPVGAGGTSRDMTREE